MPVTIHKCFCLANIRYPDEVSSMLIDRFFALQLSKRNGCILHVGRVVMHFNFRLQVPVSFFSLSFYCLSNNKFTVDSINGFKHARNQ